jgi:integrase
MATRAGRQRIGKRTVEMARPGNRDRYIWDSEIAGFGLKITPTGSKTYLFQYRFPKGRLGRVRRYTIGSHSEAFSVALAREQAAIQRGQLARGIDPMAALQAEREKHLQERKLRGNTVQALADRFLRQYVLPNNRSAKEYERILHRYVLPVWGPKPVGSIRRRDVVALLDGIVDGTGAGTVKRPRKKGKPTPQRDGRAMAHHVLAVIRKMFRWHQARDESFVSPVVAGMSPLARPSERARERILSDDEIRALWLSLDGARYPFGPLLRMLLLTAQRREEVAQARWKEIDLKTGLWTIPAARYKTKRANVVPLTKQVLDILDSLPRLGDYVFTTLGHRPFSGFSKAKAAVDLQAGLSGWRLHDLRRTARSLMTRAGVAGEIGERVLGHAIAGVAGVYDRHDYAVQKRDALEALGTEIRRIIRGDGDKVIPLRQRRARPVVS